MDNNREDWYLDIAEAIEEANKYKDDNSTDYRWCDQELFEYSLRGLDAIDC